MTLSTSAGIEPDTLRVRFNVGTGLLEDVARAGMQHVDADLLQDAQGPLVDGFDLVFGCDRRRRKGQPRLRARCRGNGCRPLSPTPGPPPSTRFGRRHRISHAQSSDG